MESDAGRGTTHSPPTNPSLATAVATFSVEFAAAGGREVAENQYSYDCLWLLLGLVWMKIDCNGFGIVLQTVDIKDALTSRFRASCCFY
jgi:hypothetical protein